MQIFIQVKQPGRKLPLMEKKSILIADPDGPLDLRQLVLAIVAQQVDDYNSKPLEKNLLPFLNKSAIEQQAALGKVAFGAIYNENKADKITAQQTALQAFEDGMYAVFANEDELSSLDDLITITPETVFTFIRLTFLAGSIW